MSMQPANYARPRSRIGQAFQVLLLAGPVGMVIAVIVGPLTGAFGLLAAMAFSLLASVVSLIIFATGQGVWGAVWRGWAAAMMILTVLAFLLS